MEVKVVGTTEKINNQENAKRLVQNHARKCYTEKIWDELVEENFKSGLVKSLIDRGHHSPFDHFVINFDFDGVPKALAMAFNNQSVYTTSEKSARYTKMSKIPEHQLGLYDKWGSWFHSEISKRFSESDFPKLYIKGSDDKTPAEKLSQENARYMTSVFTPSSMTHTVSWRQANILYHSFNDFIKENEKSSDEFKLRLADSMRGYVDSSAVKDWIIDEAQVKMKGGISLRFFRDEPVEEVLSCKDIYSINYSASFASLAQLHRHRLAVYDVSNGWQKGAPLDFYIPRLVEAAGKSNEWLEDAESVSKYDFPQAQLLKVGERGMREHIIAKSLERMCGLAQLETTRNHAEVLERLGIEIGPSCVISGEGCKKGGCIFGPDQYLERLI